MQFIKTNDTVKQSKKSNNCLPNTIIKIIKHITYANKLKKKDKQRNWANKKTITMKICNKHTQKQFDDQARRFIKQTIISGEINDKDWVFDMIDMAFEDIQ